MTKSIFLQKSNLKIDKQTKKILLGVFLVLTLTILPIVIFQIYYSQRIYPGIKIAGIDIGNKTKTEAESILEGNIVRPEKIGLIAKEKLFDLSLDGIGFSYDLNLTVEKAFSAYRSKNIIENLFSFISTKKQKPIHNLVINLDEPKLTEYLQVISSQVATEPVMPTVGIENGTVKVNKGSPGEYIDTESFQRKLSEQLLSRDFSDIEVPFVKDDSSLTDEEAKFLQERAGRLLGKNITLENEFERFILNDSVILTFLAKNEEFYEENVLSYVGAKIEPEVNREPQNAVFKFVPDNNPDVPGKVVEFIPAKNGLTVNTFQLKDKIIASVVSLESSEDKNITLTIPVETKLPEITSDKVNTLGINGLIGRGSSSFMGSIPGRVYNIGLASSKLNGVLIPPGETVSFNTVVGDVSSLTGYKSAYIIKDGRTVLGDGGGVCQVSTTLFRAALNAGLPIVERRAHSYRVGYYEQDSAPGLDATVYSPTTDLKFKNDTPAYILIQTIYDAKKMTLVFEIYGTSDGRIATVSKPIITGYSAPPEDLYVDDPTLSAGTVKQIDYKAWGAKSQFNYKVERNREVLIEKTFYSNYRPWQAVFLRGTGPAI